MIYPVAEIFHSVQGEGRWTGTPMMFVRLAGCNVGKYWDGATYEIGGKADLNVLKDKKHSICQTFDGQQFLCDTDYHASAKLTPAEILQELKTEQHICLTGGEPLMYDLSELQDYAEEREVDWHLETSGTKPVSKEVEERTWITCCPKGPMPLWEGIWEAADEWKVLVGPQFKEETLRLIVDKTHMWCWEYYLQPINGVNDVWQENVERCLELLQRWPQWKLSAQLHKFLGVR